MAERYPSDEALLAIETDAATGVEMIPTGTSPYYLQFRKLVQRLLLACSRANDLRVYADGDLTFGVRPGRCVIANTPIAFDGVTGQAVENNATTSLWLDAAGDVQASTSGLPADRTAFVPLAEVVAEAGAITSVSDLRGQAFLAIPDLNLLGLQATAAEINQALAGIDPTVTTDALNALSGGSDSTADARHRHEQFSYDFDGESIFTLTNDSADVAANVGLRFDLPNRFPFPPMLLPDLGTGWMTQRKGVDVYALVGVAQAAFTHEGELTASASGKLVGVVPIDGVVSDVILSIGDNIVSDTATDGVSATAKVNGTALTSTPPEITDADGAGFRCTAQGHGTPATIKADGTEQVAKGDVLTVDLTRTAAGSISNQASDLVVMIVIRAATPE